MNVSRSSSIFFLFFFNKRPRVVSEPTRCSNTRVALQQYPKEKHENETIPHSSCGYTRKRVLSILIIFFFPTNDYLVKVNAENA